MKFIKSLMSHTLLVASGFAMSFALAVQSIVLTSALTANSFANPSVAKIGEDEVEFLFVDKCKSGESYRLKSYKIEVNGESIQMYDYIGPRGKGTIQSDVDARQAKAFLCNEDRRSWQSSGRQSYN